jgi:hypothetical protein
MRMRATLVSIVVLVVLMSAVPLCAENNQAVEKSLKAKEQAGWQAWKDKDPKAFQDMIPDDVVNIADGTVERGKQAILKDLSSGACTVNSFSLSDFSFQWVDKDAVMMTYSATQDVTCGGKKQPGKVIASSLWVKKGGKWMSPFHQETTAEGM